MCISLCALGSVRAEELLPEGAPTVCIDGAATPNADTLIKRYEMLESLLKSGYSRFREIPNRMISDFQLGGYETALGKLEVKLEGMLGRALSDSFDPKLPKDLRSLEFDIQREIDEIMVWVKRSRPLPWKDLEAEPYLLIPGRIYSIQPKRDVAELIRVRFHRTLVEQFFWETRDSGRTMAAHQALVGVGRGERPATSSAAGGIEYYKVVDGVQVVKIQIVGRQTGAYRVYGCLKDGIFEFVLWEHEGNHDARYLSRVSHHTADLCNAL